MKKFSDFEKIYCDRIFAEGLHSALPIHAMLPRRPEIGESYGSKRRILFLGQDANNSNIGYDGMDKSELLKHITNYNSYPEAFVFENEMSANFLSWYRKSRYVFWEFPIRLTIRLYNLDYEVNDITNENILRDQHMMTHFSSFVWGNISALLFLDKINQWKKKQVELSKMDYNTEAYCRSFDIAREVFGNIRYFAATCDPDVIIILTKRFRPEFFFENEVPECVYDDNANYIRKWIWKGDRQIPVIATYHPSYMRRLGNQGKMGIQEYVEKINRLIA